MEMSIHTYICNGTHKYKVFVMCFVVLDAGIFIVFKVIQFYKRKCSKKINFVYYISRDICTQHSILLAYILKQIFGEKFIFTQFRFPMRKCSPFKSLLLYSYTNLGYNIFDRTHKGVSNRAYLHSNHCMYSSPFY